MFRAFLALRDQDAGFRLEHILVKATNRPLQLVPVLRQALRDLNPRIPLSNPRTMEDVFRTATSRTSFAMAMLGAASGIALLLGLVGIYGVISCMVAQWGKEIGVRMAMGATCPAVRGMVVRQRPGPTAVVVVLGLVAAGQRIPPLASRAKGCGWAQSPAPLTGKSGGPSPPPLVLGRS